MLDYLRAAGFEPEILFEPGSPSTKPDVDGLEASIEAGEYRIVFFQKVYGPSVERLARYLARRGISTVFGVCDFVVPEMAECTDATVIVTSHLRNLYPEHLRHKVHVVHDGIERPDACKVEYGPRKGHRGHPLRAILVTSTEPAAIPVIGHLPSWLHVTIVGGYSPDNRRLMRIRGALRQLREQSRNLRLDHLAFLLSSRIETRAWHPQVVYEQLCAADVGIIPVDTTPDSPTAPPPAWQLKSENRLTLKMCVGLPVVASPVPSYLPVIDQGRNGFLANHRSEWLKCLDALRDPELRRSIGEAARQSVLTRFSKDEQARLLIAVLRDIVR